MAHQKKIPVHLIAVLCFIQKVIWNMDFRPCRNINKKNRWKKKHLIYSFLNPSQVLRLIKWPELKKNITVPELKTWRIIGIVEDFIIPVTQFYKILQRRLNAYLCMLMHTFMTPYLFFLLRFHNLDYSKCLATPHIECQNSWHKYCLFVTMPQHSQCLLCNLW